MRQCTPGTLQHDAWLDFLEIIIMIGDSAALCLELVPSHGRLAMDAYPSSTRETATLWEHDAA